MSQIPCIITLDTNAGIITNKEDIVAYLLRNFFARTGDTSLVFESLCPCFRVLESEAKSPQILANSVGSALVTIIKRYFPDDNITVESDVEYLDTARTKYNINITVMEDSVNLLTTAVIEAVDNELYPFKLNLKRDSL